MGQAFDGGVALEPGGATRYELRGVFELEVLERRGRFTHARFTLGDGATLDGWISTRAMPRGFVVDFEGGTSCAAVTVEPLDDQVCLTDLPLFAHHGLQSERVGVIRAKTRFKVGRVGADFTVVEPGVLFFSLLPNWQLSVRSSALRECNGAPHMSPPPVGPP